MYRRLRACRGRPRRHLDIGSDLSHPTPQNPDRKRISPAHFLFKLATTLSAIPSMSIASEAAQEGSQKAARSNDHLNGKRIRADVETALEQAFTKVDVDANGRLDISDHILREQVLRANGRSVSLANFAQYDLGGDRVLTEAEIAAFARPLPPDAMPFDTDRDVLSWQTNYSRLSSRNSITRMSTMTESTRIPN